jgi:uncharacterized protein (DUF1015 family)
MATVYPFQPYRYVPSAGPLGNLVTQPYDKISNEMSERYLGLSPHNLVRIILGPRNDGDSEQNNVYTRAASYLSDWMSTGALKQDSEPAFYPYFQEFTDPDTGARLTRKGFIGLGKVEDYSAGVVHRHEQTLSGPKKDRLELLRHTKAHFGQLFMLYPDPAGAVDAMLDRAASLPPLGEVTDEYGAVHRIWRIADKVGVDAIRETMRDKKLVIADGHHRYETALAYSRENSSDAAQRVMMTFVNMHSPGLRILATHRLVSGLPALDSKRLIEQLSAAGKLERVDGVPALKDRVAAPAPGSIRIGVAIANGPGLFILEAPRESDALDVPFLHQRLLDGVLGIGEEAVREERFLRYVRGIDPALTAVNNGSAQLAFLLQPTTVEQVARISFGGGVMPQKSTDFYPKLLSGLTIYKVE